MYNKYKNSPVHQQALADALERYKNKPEYELSAMRGVYMVVRREAITDRDSRWKIPASEDKICVKEHLKLIEQALESKKPPPPVVIACQPAVMGMKTNK